MLSPDTHNTAFQLATGFINQTNQPVFLTGKAGTGKTTFLKYIKEKTLKSVVVVAPTGVAAMNAGGTTIHSFFQLPFAPFIGRQSHFSNNEQNDLHSLINHLRLSPERKEIIQQLDLLIIDEVSMVRADVLDAIDVVLRHVRNNNQAPFGGVQVLYIGDMYQLPPVVKNEEWQLLQTIYESPFFFSSQIIKTQPPVYIELDKVYRQKDKHFINLLNQVRNNEMDEDGYELLHSRYKSTIDSNDVIVLTTHNAKAQAINETAISALNAKAHYFNATVDGSFLETAYPTEEKLLLKVGAQVMFLKNDTETPRRFFNGKIGIVEKIEADKVFVQCAPELNHQPIELKKETWKNIKYTINQEGKLSEETMGSFTQFPLRLAWAITIHKSQGLTFEKVVIDAGASFAAGQVYVALSRCTSLEGLQLSTKISMSSLQSDPRIVDFAQSQQSLAKKELLLQTFSKDYANQSLIAVFNFAGVNKGFADLTSWTSTSDFAKQVANWLPQIDIQWKAIYNHSKILIVQIENLLLENKEAVFAQRVIAAATYFSNQFETMVAQISQSPAHSDNRQLALQYDEKIKTIFEKLMYHLHLMKAIETEVSLTNLQQAKYSYKKIPLTVSAFSGRSSYIPADVKHPQLFNAIRAVREQLCNSSGLPVYMVCNTQSIEQMALQLPTTLQAMQKIPGFGKIKISQFGEAFIRVIKEYCFENNITPPITSDTVIKIKRARGNKPDTKKISFDLYKAGSTVQQIASERKLTQGTIETHLCHYVKHGILPVSAFVGADTLKLLREKSDTIDEKSLVSIKHLCPTVSYADIRFFLAGEKKEEEFS